jgi:WD40 repeat protein
VETAKQIREIRSDEKIPLRIAFHPLGNWLIAGCHEGSLKLWDLGKGHLKWIQKSAHSGEVEEVAFHPKGDRLFSIGRDGTLHIWETESGLEILSHPAHPLGGSALAISPDGNTLVTAGMNSTFRLWMTKQEEANTPEGYEQATAAQKSLEPYLIDNFIYPDPDDWKKLWDKVEIPVVIPGTVRANISILPARNGKIHITADRLEPGDGDALATIAYKDSLNHPTRYANGRLRATFIPEKDKGCSVFLCMRRNPDENTCYAFLVNTETGTAQIHAVSRSPDGGTRDSAFAPVNDKRMLHTGEPGWGICTEAVCVGTRIEFKWWLKGEPEPAEPGIIGSDDSFDQGRFSLGFYRMPWTSEPISGVIEDVYFIPESP